MSPPETIPSSKYNNVKLIPWDPDSDIHAQRLYEQRVACMWDQDLIEEWKVKVREGNKFFYWIVRFLTHIKSCEKPRLMMRYDVVDTQR
jgi:hypothetical protein